MTKETSTSELAKALSEMREYARRSDHDPDCSWRFLPGEARAVLAHVDALAAELRQAKQDAVSCWHWADSGPDAWPLKGMVPALRSRVMQYERDLAEVGI